MKTMPSVKKSSESQNKTLNSESVWGDNADGTIVIAGRTDRNDESARSAGVTRAKAVALSAQITQDAQCF